MKQMNIRLTTLLASALVAGGAVAEPKVVWWSDPVKPGEAVEVFGAGFEGTRVAVGGRPVPVAKTTATGLWFVFPSDSAKRVVGVTLTGADGKSSSFTLNAPQVKWMQGENGGKSVFPGDVLRIFGRNLKVGGTAVRLGGRALKLVDVDDYSLKAEVPADFRPGRAELEVDNGESGWTKGGSVEVVRNVPFWKEKVFRITDYGAVASDCLDDTAAVQAALAAAAANGGGIVLVPPGRFQLRESIRIPEHTLLKGTGRNLSCLYWPDTDYPPEALIAAKGEFAIEDLYFHSGYYNCGLVVDNPFHAVRHDLAASRPVACRNIAIRRCSFHFVTNQYTLDDPELKNRREPGGGSRGWLIRNAENVVIEDCDLHSSRRGMYFILLGDGFRVSRCTFTGQGWSCLGGERYVFEDCRGTDITYSISTLARRFFFGRNEQHVKYENDRESLTHDGARTAFRDAKAPGTPGLMFGGAYDGRSVDLDLPDGTVWSEGTNFWIGAELQIVTGTGAGQSRRITDIVGSRRVLIDRPFLIAPDATSRFEPCYERQDLLYVDNVMTDSGVGIQLYGGCTDCIVARNRTSHNGGLIGAGRNYHSFIPMWFTQFLDNTIEDGNSCRGPHPDSPYLPMDAWLGSHMTWATEAHRLTLATVVRGNVLKGNAMIKSATFDGIVEGNRVSDATEGISYDFGRETVYETNNVLQGIRGPVERAFRKWYVREGVTIEKTGAGRNGPVNAVIGKWPGTISVKELLPDAKRGDTVTVRAKVTLARPQVFRIRFYDRDMSVYFTKSGDPRGPVKISHQGRIPRLWPAGEYELRLVKRLNGPEGTWPINYYFESLDKE